MTAYGYSRTSLGPAGGQDGQGQLWKLAGAGIPAERIYMDEGKSGMVAPMDRPAFAALAGVLAAGDTVTVPELSRIGRSTKDVLQVMEDFEAQGIGLVILDIGLDTSTPVGRAVAVIMSAISRLERDYIAMRTRDKLAALKAEGVQLGGKPKLDAGQAEMVVKMRAAGLKPADIGTALGVSRATVYNYLRRAQDAPAA